MVTNLWRLGRADVSDDNTSGSCAPRSLDRGGKRVRHPSGQSYRWGDPLKANLPIFKVGGDDGERVLGVAHGRVHSVSKDLVKFQEREMVRDTWILIMSQAPQSKETQELEVKSHKWWPGVIAVEDTYRCQSNPEQCTSDCLLLVG